MKIRIKQIAKAQGKTQEMIANDLGVNIATVRYYYKSEKLSLDTIQRLADYFGVPAWKMIVAERDVIEQGEGIVLAPNGERYALHDLSFIV